ncbi:MAG: ABC transporter permease [Actinobacteria bacterium]|nr:MAG: ABC transporter permease [Actinomycetota bacterium]RIK06958.1 MAG: hypothetical protein DCC48_05595 [Acidobacteriota bacterium]
MVGPASLPAPYPCGGFLVRSLYGIGTRFSLAHKGRTSLTVAAITLGVAVLFAAVAVTASIERSLQESLEGFTGAADVVATPLGSVDGVMSPAEAREITDLDSVDASAMIFAFPTAVDSGPEGQVFEMYGSTNRFGLQVLGVDPQQLGAIYTFDVDRGEEFSPGAPEAVVPAELAEVLEVVPGDTIGLATPHGRAELTVTGVLARSGAGLFNDGIAVYTSMRTAHDLAGIDEGVSFVALDLQPGVDTDRWIDEYGGAAGSGVTIIPATEVNESVRAAVQGFGATLTVLAGIVLFVATLLIFLSFAMSIAQRSRSIGILRSVGVSKLLTARLVLVETLVLGLVAVVMGLALGAVLAKVLLTFVSPLPTIPPPIPMVVTPLTVAIPLVTGLVASLVGALRPALRAAGIDPVPAMRQPIGAEARSTGPRWAWAFVLGAAGVTLVAVGLDGAAPTAAGLVLVLLSVVLVAPRVLRSVASVALGRRIGGMSSTIVAAHLTRGSARSGSIFALATVALTATVTLAAVQGSFSGTAERQIDAQFDVDVTLSAASSFDEAFVEQLQQVRGVEATSPTWWSWSDVATPNGLQQIRVRAIDPGLYFEVADFDLVEGDRDSIIEALDGTGILLPEMLADDLDVAVGDTVEITATSGPARLTVAGVFRSIGSTRSADQYSAPVLGIGAARRLLAADQPAEIQVAVDAASDPGEVVARIDESLAQRYSFVAETGEEAVAPTRDQLQALTGVLGLFAAMAALVAVLGLSTTLVVSVMERSREVGVLRALGASKPEVRRLVVLEAALVVAGALVLAIPLGAVLSIPVVRLAGDSLGSRLIHVFPLHLIPVAASVGLVMAVAAAAAPAHRIAALDVASALSHE